MRDEPTFLLSPHVKMLLRVVCVAASVFLACSGETVGESAGWTSFQNGGHPVIRSPNLPTHWSPESNIAWTVNIKGYGQSTPVVAHGEVVVTSTSGDNKDDYHVTSYDPETGEKKWQVTRRNPSPYKNTPMVSRAAPSAIASNNGFVAFFEGGLLIGLSDTGEVSWERNLVEQFGPIQARHGLSASLETDGQRAYVWVERQDDPYVMAVNPATGEEIWKVPGIGTNSWSSPRLVPVGDRRHLVCSGNGRIVGYDPDSGDQLWTFEEISGNTSCTPIPVGDGQFLVGASTGRQERNAGTAAANNTLLRIAKTEDDQYQVAPVWRAETASSTFGSPAIAGATAAFVNQTGVLFLVNLATGEAVSNRRVKAGSIWATPIATADHLYVFGYKGTTSVIALESGEEIASNRCWPTGTDSPGFGGGDVLYAAAVAGERLIIRRGDRLFAIQK